MSATPNRVKGFAIVSAIFILVVLAALGAFIVSISTSQQAGAAQGRQRHVRLRIEQEALAAASLAGRYEILQEARGAAGSR